MKGFRTQILTELIFVVDCLQYIARKLIKKYETAKFSTLENVWHQNNSTFLTRMEIQHSIDSKFIFTSNFISGEIHGVYTWDY